MRARGVESPRRDSAARKISRCRAASSATTNIVLTTRSLNPFRQFRAERMPLLGTSWTDNDVKLHSHAKQIRSAGSAWKMLTLAVARSETIARKSAVSLQSQRVSSGPGSGQDVLKRTAFAVASQTIPRPQRCWTLGGAVAACKNSGGALDRCNRSKHAALLAPAATTAFSELLGLSPTIPSCQNTHDGQAPMFSRPNRIRTTPARMK